MPGTVPGVGPGVGAAMPSLPRQLARHAGPVVVLQRGLAPRRAAGLAVLGALGGAAAAYLLDPDRGRSRRARMRDRASHAVYELNEGAGTLSRDMGNRGRGLLAGARYRMRGGAVDDRVLHERVREVLGRHLGHPRAVEAHVEDRVVTLTGDVLAREEGQARRAVGRIPGVGGVEARWTAHRDPTDVPSLQGQPRRREPVPELLQQHWSPTARLLAGTAGAGIWTANRQRPGLPGLGLRVFGLGMLARAVTNLPVRRLTGIGAGRRAIDISQAICVEAPAEQVWRVVSDYANFPRFLGDVREVRRLGDDAMSHWEITGPAGVTIRFDAEETRREDGRLIAWKSLPGQPVGHSGRILVEPEDSGRTRVEVRLTYNPVAGAVGHAVATLLGADPSHKLNTDLARLKTFVETGREPANSAAPRR